MEKPKLKNFKMYNVAFAAKGNKKVELLKLLKLKNKEAKKNWNIKNYLKNTKAYVLSINMPSGAKRTGTGAKSDTPSRVTGNGSGAKFEMLSGDAGSGEESEKPPRAKGIGSSGTGSWTCTGEDPKTGSGAEPGRDSGTDSGQDWYGADSGLD